ncbi:pth11-like integral membrane protein [Rutstroemia sp. NJR-2017a WRK4]|nr:pth11-like integral membrane protein [Rutstroemia sp. NJR-2017a WRK4]
MGSPTTPSVATTVEIITWFLLVVSVLATSARVSTKWALAKAFNWDDLTCVISLILNIGAGVGASMMAENGLGVDEATLSESSLQHERCGVALAALIIVWGILSLWLAAFQCKTPEVWRAIDGSCFNRVL